MDHPKIRCIFLICILDKLVESREVKPSRKVIGKIAAIRKKPTV
jgi:hypothetical protein